MSYLLNWGRLFWLWLLIKIDVFLLTITRFYYVFYNSFSIVLKRHECLITGGPILLLFHISYYVIPCNLLTAYSPVTPQSPIRTACWLISTCISPLITCSPPFFGLKTCLNNNTIWVKPTCLAFTEATPITTFWFVCSYFQEGKSFKGEWCFGWGVFHLHTLYGLLLIEIRFMAPVWTVQFPFSRAATAGFLLCS